MGRAATTLFHLFFFFLNAFSAQLFWFNGLCFTEALKAASGSHKDDVPQMRPTYERRWLTRLFPQLGKQPLIQLKSNTRPLNCLTKISMWLAIHQSGIRLVRCERNYNHTSLRKISYNQEESGMGPGPTPHPVVSQQASIVHCSIRLLFPYFWADGACM